MELSERPDSLLVLGGGYVALELAQMFARLGSKVTLLVRSRLASKEEPEVSRSLQEVFADEGIRVVRRAVPSRVARDTVTGQVVVMAEVSGGEQEFRADEILVALGRRPVTEGLNLEAVGVRTGEAGQIVVTDQLQTAAMAMAMSFLSMRGTDDAIRAADDRPDPEEAVAREELLGRIREAIATLPDAERTLLQRHYFEDVTFDQVAKDIGLSKSWASRLHTRALETVARTLGNPKR